MSTENRQMRIERFLNAPVELVWKVWTDPDHIKNWWGPAGFTNTIDKMEVKEGGVWEFVMHAPDGTNFKNKHLFSKIEKHKRIVMEHVTGPKFSLEVNFTKQGNGTLMVWTNTFESAEQLQEVIKVFKADVGLKQNIEKLEEYLKKQ